MAVDTTRAVAALNSAVAALRQSTAALEQTIAELNDPWFHVDRTGATDVTDQVQALVSLGRIPAGRYLIDPVKMVTLLQDCDGAVDADGMPATFFVCKPSATPRDCVVAVAGAGITVRNIRVIGDRMSGAYTAGSTNEWGYGFKVTGAGSTLENCYAELCTGDGWGIAAANVTLIDCWSDRNRRQALSGFNCPGLRVLGGNFTNTGAVTIDGVTDAAAPNGPWAGFDIEPDKLAVGQPNVDVLLRGVTVTGNKGSGVQAYLRSEVGGAVSVLIDGCDIRNNTDGVRGEAVAGKVGMTVVSSNLYGHKGAAVRANSGATIIVATGLSDANTIQGLKPRSPSFTKAGIVTPYDLKQYGTGIIKAAENHYV